MAKSTDLLGELLVNRGVITPEQLQEALEEQKRIHQPLGATLLYMGIISEEKTILPSLAEKYKTDFVSLKSIAISSEAMACLPAKAVNHYKVFPVKYEQGVLTVAMQDPSDVGVLDDLAMVSHAAIRPVVAGERDIMEAIREHYGLGAQIIEKMMSDSQISAAEAPAIETIDETTSEASISKFLNQILLQAYHDKATDIHIEPFGSKLRIRYRIDGILYDAQVSENIQFFKDELISRIKILSNLNIAEKRLPQDGRFKVKVENTDMDLRVTFLPTSFGESCVIRLLNTFRLYNFEELGIIGSERRHLDTLLMKQHGIIFLTGPTGSGKTTTLYSCLAALNSEDTKIITVEDPVEYQLKGVVQVQASPAIGLTFANALRSILRNDPDVIMIGEVRDFETAQIAIQMSLTGHLVFSTLHTNDAASGITRLIDIGIEPYLIASSVECFLAQRLVRLLCPSCKRQVDFTDELKREFELNAVKQVPAIYEAVGCKKCRMTGYSGRQAICEFLVLNEKIRSMVTGRSTSREIKQMAILEGMKTLRQHGWEKVAAGLTSPSEVLRATEDN
ncbi:MAG: Flp pilus assembly complex ATPase component TadA [Candidatus Omnitrophica bacterium]|nr:Flp pilus assembly complex ATPase component TadA [Candidatus Omnitrophota bacterium]